MAFLHIISPSLSTCKEVGTSVKTKFCTVLLKKVWVFLLNAERDSASLLTCQPSLVAEVSWADTTLRLWSGNGARAVIPFDSNAAISLCERV